jgi:hypothetical protein
MQGRGVSTPETGDNGTTESGSPRSPTGPKVDRGGNRDGQPQRVKFRLVVGNGGHPEKEGA